MSESRSSVLHHEGAWRTWRRGVVGAGCALVLAGVLASGVGQAVPASDLTPAELAWLAAHGPIRYAPDPAFPPFEYFAADGSLKGITPEFLAIMGRRLGIEFRPVHYPTWSHALAGIRLGESDLLGTLTRTAERETFLEFTEPYLWVPYVLFLNQDVAGIRGIEDMRNRRLGVVRDYGGHAWLGEHYPDLPITPVNDTRAGLVMVSTGELDALLETLPVGAFVLRQNSLSNVRIAPQQVFQTPQHLAVPRGNHMLAGILQKGLDSVTEAERTAIFLRFTGQDVSRPSGAPAWFARGLIGLGALVVLVAVWNIALRRQVRQRTRDLAASEQRYRTVADFTSDWEYWLRPDGTLAYMSPSCQDVTGYDREAFASDRDLIIRITHPDDRRLLTQHRVAEGLAEPLPGLDFRLVRKNGEERWISHLCRPVFNEDGSYAGRRASNRDITDRKGTEDALSRYSARLERVQELTRAMRAAPAPAEVLTQALGRLRRLVGCERASVLWFEQDGESAVLLAVDESRNLGLQAGERVRVAELERIEDLRRNSMATINDLGELADLSPCLAALRDRGVAAVLIAPLTVENRLLGQLTLSCLTVSGFTAEHVAIAQDVADQFALTLALAELRRRVAAGTPAPPTPEATPSAES